MTGENLLKLIRFPNETEWVEFKIDNKFHQEVGEYISALSNGACLHEKKHGYLIYGVNNATHDIVGTKFRPREEKIGNEILENWLTRLLDPRIDFKIHEFNSNSLPIVVFEIDATSSKPVSFKGIAYIRVGSYKKKLKDHPEKERKIWRKCSRISFEEDIAMRGQSEDEVLRLLDYPAYFLLNELNLPTNKSGILSKLEQERLISKHSGKYNITNLGAVLFARDLRNFDVLNRKAIRVIQYKGKNKLSTIKEQVGVKGYACGFRGLIGYINDKLPSNEELGKVFRKETKMYPEVAIRELVANALIHQDFEQSGTGPMVEIYSDRIEISNPGQPLIDTLRFLDHSPKSRNEEIAAFMRRVKICEERGSGIDKVVFETEFAQLPAPKFEREEDYLRATLYSHRTLRQMDREDKIRAAYLHCCLKYISSDPMTNQSLRVRFGVLEKNYPFVSRIISDTIKANLIKPAKVGKSKTYVPIWA